MRCERQDAESAKNTERKSERVATELRRMKMREKARVGVDEPNRERKMVNAREECRIKKENAVR